MYGSDHTSKTEKAYDMLEEHCHHEYDYLGNSASAHDCTGLIPSGMVSEEELLSYQDLYDFPPPVPKMNSPKPRPDQTLKKQTQAAAKNT